MVKRVKPKKSKPTPKRFCVTWSKRPVRLMHRGEQCSEVKWLDTGSTQTIPNDQLELEAKNDNNI